MPVNKISSFLIFRDLSIENLRFLSSRQALADLAEFIDFFREERKLPNNKLIAFGGSYPGECTVNLLIPR